MTSDLRLPHGGYEEHCLLNLVPCGPSVDISAERNASVLSVQGYAVPDVTQKMLTIAGFNITSVCRVCLSGSQYSTVSVRQCVIWSVVLSLKLNLGKVFGTDKPAGAIDQITGLSKGLALPFYMQMMFVPHRKQTNVPSQPVAEMG
jgi:hypothetical protein